MRLGFLLVALIFFTGMVCAQDKRTQDAARRLAASNQRLAAEKAQLEREKGELAKKLGDSQKAAAEAEKELKGQQVALARARRDLKALDEDKSALIRTLEQRLADTEKREAALKVSLEEAQKKLAHATAEGEQLARRVANQKDTIAVWQEKTGACEARNGELSRLGYELVERYRGKSCADIAIENEPFTGIGRARTESLLEDYQDRLRAQKFDARRDPIKQGAAQ